MPKVTRTITCVEWSYKMLLLIYMTVTLQVHTLKQVLAVD